MGDQAANTRIISKLLFRLLPFQVLLAAVGAVNGFVSSFFASNVIGTDAMTALGLYTPIYTLISAVNTVMVGGAAIICGEHLGRNQEDRLQGVFSLDLLGCFLVAAVFMLIL